MLHRDFGQGVLVVDDHLVMRTVVAQALVAAGYQVVLAENGDQAVECLRLRTYALVITDRQMPVGEGSSLIRHVRQTYPELPVLVMTGQTTGLNASDALRDRAAGCLVKPFTPDELRQAIEKALGRRPDVSEPAAS